MSNYPPGAEHDPEAPYNRKDPKMSVWEAEREGMCESCENPFTDLNEDFICKECYIPEELDEDT